MPYVLSGEDAATPTDGRGKQNAFGRFNLPVILDAVTEEGAEAGKNIGHRWPTDESIVQP